jgi:hypothetical protein
MIYGCGISTGVPSVVAASVAASVVSSVATGVPSALGWCHGCILPWMSTAGSSCLPDPSSQLVGSFQLEDTDDESFLIGNGAFLGFGWYTGCGVPAAGVVVVSSDAVVLTTWVYELLKADTIRAATANTTIINFFIFTPQYVDNLCWVFSSMPICKQYEFQIGRPILWNVIHGNFIFSNSKSLLRVLSEINSFMEFPPNFRIAELIK